MQIPLKGRIHHSLAYWPFSLTPEQGGAPGSTPLSVEGLGAIALKYGVKSVELVAPSDFPTLKDMGLTCAIGLMKYERFAPFAIGFANQDHHDQVLMTTRTLIDQCSEFGVPNVIAFTGYSAVGADGNYDPLGKHIGRDNGVANCVKGLRAAAEYAARKHVVVCLEHLNSRDRSHPMKGHYGYWGDDLDVCAEIVRQVNSPAARLLADVYHIQVMHGDLVRRLRDLGPLIGHIHTAGNPGRGELNDRQEINYGPIMRALVDYSGILESWRKRELHSPPPPHRRRPRSRS